MFKSFRTLSGVALVAAVASSGVFAAQLEEIIVTSTKTEQTLQSIPIAVSVVNAQQLEDANVKDLMDLKHVVPSLDTRTNQISAASSVYIRGFGGGGNDIGIEPAVAIVVDGVYRTRIAGALDDLPVVERIEVLRGPQSTLFGKSASAGVVSIVTKEPSHDALTKISVGTGNYSLKTANIYSTFSATDDLAIALSGSITERDGFFENQTPGVPGQINNKDRSSLRADFLYTPSEDLSIRVIADGSDADEACCGVVNTYRMDAGAYRVVAALGGSIPNAANDPKAAWAGKTYYSFLPSNSNESKGLSVTVEKDMGWGTLTSMTAYREMEYSSNQDVDFDSAPITQSGIDSLALDSVQQELRLSFTTGNVDWNVGAFYSDEDFEGRSELKLGSVFRNYMDAQASAITGAPAFGPSSTFASLEAGLAPYGFLGTNPETGEAYTQFYAGGQGVVDTGEQSVQSLSLFAQADIMLTDQLSLLVGVSRLQDDKEVSLSQAHNVPFSAIPAVYVGAASALQYLKPQAGYTNQTSEDTNTDYTAKLSYAYTEDMTFYGGVATGFKPKSWDVNRDVLPNNLYAEPEESTVYEIGAKIKLSNGYINIAYFDQEVKNFQTRTFVGGGYAFSNAPIQTSNGFEFDTAFALSENVFVTFGGIIHDPMYGDNHFVGALDLSNTRPSRVSKQRFTGSVSYAFSALGFENMLSLTGLSESDYYTLENPTHRAVLATNGFDTSSKDVVNMNLTMTKGSSTVTFWASNLFEEEWMETTFISPASDAAGAAAAIFSGYPSAPRTFGVTYSLEL